MLTVDILKLHIRDYYLYGAFICALFSLYVKLVSGRHINYVDTVRLRIARAYSSVS